MALVNCKKCGQQISDTASVCLNCGAETGVAPQPRSTNQPYRPRRRVTSRKLAIIAVLIALEFAIFWRPKTDSGNDVSPGALGTPNGPPENVIHKLKHLKEGESVNYPFFLARDARVHIEVTATPKPVDVMVMTGDDFTKFQQAEGRFLRFLAPEYTSRLTAQDVTTFDKTDILPGGNWALVVTRPRESIFLKKETTASTLMTIY